jgi:hypothetical protein
MKKKSGWRTGAPKPLHAWRRRAAVWVTVIFCGGCTTNIGGDFCAIYIPVMPDYTHDTPETVRQIDLNNTAFDAVCM